MNLKLFRDPLGRLRILGWLEGFTLLALVLIAVPMKYLQHDGSLVQMLGPVHGVAFLLFLFNALSVGVARRWSFSRITWKLLLACFIPFGTFYIDHYILRPLYKTSV
jgi:integral membrane protein